MQYEEKIQLAKENLLNVGEKAIYAYLEDADAENARAEFARLVDDLRKLCTDRQITFESVIDNVQDTLIEGMGDCAVWGLFDFVDLRFWRL